MTFSIVRVVAVLGLFVGGASAQSCNICRDSPDGTRSLADPSQSFVMNGDTWTCGYLQETVQDVNPYSGAPGEARWCALAQTWAEPWCTCNGPAIPATTDLYKDPNPACDLCAGSFQFDSVPQVNAELTANTGVAGTMNCLGLYQAAAEGVLSSNLCPTVIANAGATCCNVEGVEGGGGSTGGGTAPAPATATCAGATAQCSSSADCCDGLACTSKNIGSGSYCSSARTRERQSIASAGIGGAAGRSRAGH